MPVCILARVSRGSAAEQGLVEQEQDPDTRLGAEGGNAGLLCQPTLTFTTPQARQSLPESLNNQLYPAHELMEVIKESQRTF